MAADDGVESEEVGPWGEQGEEEGRVGHGGGEGHETEKAWM